MGKRVRERKQRKNEIEMRRWYDYFLEVKKRERGRKRKQKVKCVQTWRTRGQGNQIMSEPVNDPSTNDA